MAIISTEAVVLRTIDHRETSKIAFFFTAERGRAIGVLKGIRKDPKKFSSSLEKFSVNHIVYYEYRNSDIHLVAQCDMKEYFHLIRGDLRRIHAAEYAAELVNKIMPLEERNREVYELLLGYFRAVSVVTPGADLNRLVHMFQIKMLALSGFRPHIDSCVLCGKGVSGRLKFSMAKGGLVCGLCRERAAGVDVSRGAVASLLYVERNTWKDCLKLKIPNDIRQELKQILNAFLLFHLEKNIKSSRFLA
jgi:DNA repair protein RecO (recombination protein O)